MSINLEIESKCMITKEDYKNLLSKYSSFQPYKQINYYIASKEIKDKLTKFGLRIRKKNGSYELTLKIKEKEGHTEINQEITAKSFIFLKYFHKFPSGEVSDYLIESLFIDTSKLRIIGSLTTIRTDLNFMGSLISIDMSKYNHKTDYEIECEDKTPIAAKTNLEIFLSQNNIKYQKSELSKLARFLKSK